MGQTVTLASQPYFQSIITYIVDPVVLFAFIAALLYFLWGMVKYIWSLSQGSKNTGIDDGKRHMVWGVVGMAIMLCVFGIMQFIWNTVTQNGTATGLNGQVVPAPPEISHF